MKVFQHILNNPKRTGKDLLLIVSCMLYVWGVILLPSNELRILFVVGSVVALLNIVLQRKIKKYKAEAKAMREMLSLSFVADTWDIVTDPGFDTNYRKLKIPKPRPLNIQTDIIDKESELSFGHRGDDGYASVYKNGKELCRVFVFTEEQMRKIEKIRDEVYEELRTKENET